MQTNTLYSISEIRIDLDKLISNSASIDLFRILTKERVMHRITDNRILCVPYIQGTELFFSDDFDNYTYNKYDVDMLLMLGLVKRLSSRCVKMLEIGVRQTNIKL